MRGLHAEVMQAVPIAGVFVEVRDQGYRVGMRVDVLIVETMPLTCVDWEAQDVRLVDGVDQHGLHLTADGSRSIGPAPISVRGRIRVFQGVGVQVRNDPWAPYNLTHVEVRWCVSGGVTLKHVGEMGNRS